VPIDSFTPIYFDYAQMISSNLGGQGGRCVDTYYVDQQLSVPWSDLCERQQPTVNVPDSSPTARDGNMDLVVRNVGQLAANGGLTEISLRITNVTEYYGWNTRHNGVKRLVIGNDIGYFGAINLLGPRSATQRPVTKQWTNLFTLVQLNFAFLTDLTPGQASRTYQPITLGRTFLTFYDFDTGAARFSGSNTQHELLQIDPQAIHPEMMWNTEVTGHSSWASAIGSNYSTAGLQTLGPNAASVLSQPWTSNVYKASTYGVGEDNPFSAFSLTDQQRMRAVMVMFESVSSFDVRYSISACCTTGERRTLHACVHTRQSVCLSCAAVLHRAPPRSSTLRPGLACVSMQVVTSSSVGSRVSRGTFARCRRHRRRHPIHRPRRRRRRHLCRLRLEHRTLATSSTGVRRFLIRPCASHLRIVRPNVDVTFPAPTFASQSTALRPLRRSGMCSIH
jgi:hypothetical protein